MVVFVPTPRPPLESGEIRSKIAQNTLTKIRRAPHHGAPPKQQNNPIKNITPTNVFFLYFYAYLPIIARKVWLSTVLKGS